jgi:hypothetical protein
MNGKLEPSTMTDKETITENLPTLSEKELRELRARIDFLLRGAPKSPTKTNGNGAGNGAGSEDPVLMVLEVIHRLCRDHGVESRPLEALRGSHGYPAFAEKVPQVLSSLGAKTFTVPELRTLLRLSLGLTLEELTHMGVPVSASVLMNHVHRVPGVLDTHFPGYREAGMLKLVVRSDGAPDD